MIGTHNSATGEPSKNFLYSLLIPFARCQSKTICEQYQAGCRFFDLRVKYDSQKRLHFAHGLWHSSRFLDSVLFELNIYSANNIEKTWVIITYEGSLSQEQQLQFAAGITQLLSHYPNISLAYMAVKKPKWTTIIKDENCPPNYQGFYDLSKWYRWFCVIPWIWHLFPQPKEKEGYRLVDFL